MMALIGNSGILFLVFHLLVWLPAPITSLHATSLGSARGNGVGKSTTHSGPDDSLNHFQRVTHRIRRGDTLGNLLKPYGLSGKEHDTWVRSISKQYSPRRLRPGQEIYFYYSANGNGHNGHAQNGHSRPATNGRAQSKGQKRLQALSLELDEDWVLNWRLAGEEIVFQKYQRPYEVEVQAAAGTITDTLYDTAEKMGLDSEVVSQLVDIFGWEVNFQIDVRDGDSFRVLFERKYRRE
ncbi:MAG: hypothetical protein GTO40_15250, partial [Deltaproteobacteria bacterium]|nr:hypothetical protein [Deltaproteobacteria bacterium]